MIEMPFGIAQQPPEAAVSNKQYKKLFYAATG